MNIYVFVCRSRAISLHNEREWKNTDRVEWYTYSPVFQNVREVIGLVIVVEKQCGSDLNGTRRASYSNAFRYKFVYTSGSLTDTDPRLHFLPDINGISNLTLISS